MYLYLVTHFQVYEIDIWPLCSMVAPTVQLNATLYLNLYRHNYRQAVQPQPSSLHCDSLKMALIKQFFTFIFYCVYGLSKVLPVLSPSFLLLIPHDRLLYHTWDLRF